MPTSDFFTHRPEQNLLVFRWPAEAGHDSIDTLYEQVTKHAVRQETDPATEQSTRVYYRRILLDLRRATDHPVNKIEWMYRTLLPYIVQQQPELPLRAAFLLSGEQPGWQQLLPAETTQRLHGFAAATFSEESAAMEWLQVPS